VPRPDACAYPVVGMFSPSLSERLVNLVLTAWLGLDGLSPISSRIRQQGTYGIRDVGTVIRCARATFEEFRRGRDRPFQLMCPSWSH
jgi:hypothetical protein